MFANIMGYLSCRYQSRHFIGLLLVHDIFYREVTVRVIITRVMASGGEGRLTRSSKLLWQSGRQLEFSGTIFAPNQNVLTVRYATFVDWGTMVGSNRRNFNWCDLSK